MSTDQRGLGSDNMSEEEKRRIQSEGGKASHGGGRKSGEETEEERRGESQSDNPENFANDPERASEAGRKGGQNSQGGGR